MDFQLNEDQQVLVDAVRSILKDHAELPQAERFSYAYADSALQRLLAENGFLDAARSIGPLEAALVVYEAAKSLPVIEAAGCGLVAPMALPELEAAGPVALARLGDLDKPIRNLTLARTLLVDCGDDVVVIDLEEGDVEPVPSIFAYPYGRFIRPPDLEAGRRFDARGEAMRQWWRVAIAAEIAGAARAAIDFTIGYVKQRHVFGRPVGAFQSVWHRLVQRHGHAKSAYFLAMRAAWSGEAVDADTATCHALLGIQPLVFDLHQFNGGMGVTTEYSLHFWLYRIRALQAEVGGLSAAALAIADRRWPAGGVAVGVKEMAGR
jgi:alkylation response protein AidB-like acyl-CoA dehydrogenase